MSLGLPLICSVSGHWMIEAFVIVWLGLTGSALSAGCLNACNGPRKPLSMIARFLTSHCWICCIVPTDATAGNCQFGILYEALHAFHICPAWGAVASISVCAVKLLCHLVFVGPELQHLPHTMRQPVPQPHSTKHLILSGSPPNLPVCSVWSLPVHSCRHCA